MGSIQTEITRIANAKTAIRTAINNKGGTVSDTALIDTYATAINNLSTGGGSGGAGSVFKITNKLNGQFFGGPAYKTNSSREILHRYKFEGGTLGSSSIIANYNPNYVGYEVYPNILINAFTNVNANIVGAGVHTLGGCAYGLFYLLTLKDGSIVLNATGNASSSLVCPLIYIAFDTKGNYDIDFFSIQTAGGACLLKDTKITLSDNSYKNIQDITYNDELLVWNFDEGKYDKAKPLWIKKTQISSFYYECKLDNGTILNLVGSNGKCHRLFCIEDGMFISATDMVGKTTYTENGVVKVVSCERVEKEVEFYNLITHYHMNLFANKVLTSCRYNNIYPIQDMKFVKDDRLNRAPQWKLYESFRDHRSLDRFIDGLRLYEQLNIPLEDTIKYCENLERIRKNIDDFDENKDLVKDIEDTEVGWIDREGKVYGFRLYMSGHYNHVILADKICKELGINTDNPSMYLEKEGWLKYTTDYVFNSDDKEITDKQLNSLRKFLKTPNKLKKEGKIRIGDYMSPHVDISEFDTMDKYSFEYRKRHNRI